MIVLTSWLVLMCVIVPFYVCLGFYFSVDIRGNIPTCMRSIRSTPGPGREVPRVLLVVIVSNRAGAWIRSSARQFRDDMSFALGTRYIKMRRGCSPLYRPLSLPLTFALISLTFHTPPLILALLVYLDAGCRSSDLGDSRKAGLSA